MKEIKKLFLGIILMIGANAFGQTTVNGYPTYIPSLNKTFVTSVKPTISTEGPNTKITFNSALGQTPGNHIPDDPDNLFVNQGPIFYHSGPGPKTLTCGGSGICAELSDVTLIITIYPF